MIGGLQPNSEYKESSSRWLAAVPSHWEVRNLRTLNTAVTHLEREIELLPEYRTRLVVDVVTGKLAVREVAARLPTQAAEPRAEPALDDGIAEETEVAHAAA